MSADKPRRLGRGLEALLGATTAPSTPTPSSAQTAAEAVPPSARNPLQSIPIAQIRPNPFQPRKEFRAEELAELEASLRASGLLQPITVRHATNGDGYELIAGERRLRAATRLGWSDIAAVVKDIDDRTLLTLALVENLQRSDLNPIEEAEGYQRLVKEFGLTQQQVAEVTGKDRSTVANLLRVLNLPSQVRAMVQGSQLSLGHARALLALGDERAIIALANEVIARELSVREVEQRVRGKSQEPEKLPRAKTDGAAARRSPEVKRLEDELRRHLQTDVTISLAERDRGRIEIAFYSADDLDRVLELVLGSRRERL